MLNLAAESIEQDSPSAYGFALAGLARLAVSCTTLDESVRNRLDAVTRRYVKIRTPLLTGFRDYCRSPREADRPLVAVASHFGLSAVETLAVRLAVAVEEDLLIGHVLTHLQQPLAHSRPTIGLLTHAYCEDHQPNLVHVLGQGQAVQCGLLQLSGDESPLPERHVRIPLPSSLALRGVESFWPGTAAIRQDGRELAVPLGQTAERRAAALGGRLAATAEGAPVVIIRGGDSVEARVAAASVCAGAGRHPVLVSTDQLGGMAPWLFLRGLVPVFSQWLAPGERKSLPAVPNFTGPLIVLTGPDGDFESDGRVLIEWRLEVPRPAEREILWSTRLGSSDLAHRVAFEHRQTAGRIAALAEQVRDEAAHGKTIAYEDIRMVARRGESIGLGALAELIPDEIGDDALVVPDSLREELEALVVRCRLREQFAQSLGPSIKARYRPSIRALFVGPSGTGKTLAAAWLATRLGIPLCRVDLSAVTSKYIGETEKNLSQLLSRAEQTEVVLLFDEADALFGKRTDIREANDRFANAQTNYLLQRMESYDGITVLTSNSRARFDTAFMRRFDAILTFPSPTAQERRALWGTHLGEEHAVSPAQLNLLAAVVDFSGGQIRNAVLGAAVAAAQESVPIAYLHVLTGVTTEYRKISRQLPDELKHASDREA
ncbi:MAG TPA: AAA family ATPase [Candidatus Dormibacteraeota bacterium]|nr:AAA family ATPase [Candidatus Dormibacteraeota bacterium]